MVKLEAITLERWAFRILLRYILLTTILICRRDGVNGELANPPRRDPTLPPSVESREGHR